MIHPHVRPLREQGQPVFRGDVVDDTFGRGASSLKDPAQVGVVGEPDRSGLVDTLDRAGLRDLVRTLPVIEQAKGVLIGYYGISADQAFRVLRRWSSVRHVKIRDLCSTLVEGVAGFPRPDLTDGLGAILDRVGPGGSRTRTEPPSDGAGSGRDR